MLHESTVQLAWLTESTVTKDGIHYQILNVNMAIRSMEIHILTVNMSVYMRDCSTSIFAPPKYAIKV